jgi:uncharacterized membrane protein required for colicin V production
MVFGFNWFDLLVVLGIVLYAFFASRRGFLAGSFEFVTLALSLLGALLLFPFLGIVLSFGGLPPQIGTPVSFVLIWSLFETLGILAFRDLIKQIPMGFIISQFNRKFGFFPNIITGLLVCLFLATVIIVLPTNASIKLAVIESRITGTLLPHTVQLNASLEEVFSKSIRDGLTQLTKN